MADRQFLESLKIEDNIFELAENCKIGYLIRYYAPCTGCGEHEFPAGIKFCLTDNMRDDAMYMRVIDTDSELANRLAETLREKERTENPVLYERLAGFSFFITELQLKSLPLNFISGSRERCLEIMKLIRQSNKTI